ncbi:MAG: 3,4-dihydroxy-2-butanone 4-phosphate synthase [Methanomassiliicoccales archaeon PtaU1.Bin124]|nr:MAG: 3,4-dihydroxy-2-butanone 4-phosphate synthase [Methanomassiliicoccales archaeon PtaU1.Bin124]
MRNTVQDAISDINKGKMVLVFDFDDRERETDMTIASQFVTAETIREMRKNAGGLICTTVHNDLKEALDLPFLAEVFGCSSQDHPVLTLLSPNDLPYDTKSAFGITINHRKTFTGITDKDRALTVSEFAKLAAQTTRLDANGLRAEFGRNFRAPGHIHLLNASKELLSQRFGHTELTTALMVMAGVTPSSTICEMMGDDGNALNKEQARHYAEKNDLCFLEGKQVIEAWRDWGKKR